MSEFEQIFKFIEKLNYSIQYLGITKKEMESILNLIYREEK